MASVARRLETLRPSSSPTTSPGADPTLRPIFHVGGLANQAHYVGDANGLMYRRVPFGDPDAGGLFHVFYQCVNNTDADGLHWCHAVSNAYVRWWPVPGGSGIGPGAESGAGVLARARGRQGAADRRRGVATGSCAGRDGYGRRGGA